MHGATVDLLGNMTLLKIIIAVIMLADAQGTYSLNKYIAMHAYVDRHK